MVFKERGNERFIFLVFGVFASILLIFASTFSPLTAKAKTHDNVLSEEQVEISELIQNYLSFDVKKGEVVITNKGQLQKALRTSGLNKKEYKVTYNEVKDTVQKLNSVINSEAGEKFKSDILWELRTTQTDYVQYAALSGCGYATLAGFAHTTAFAGLMTVAGISGPAGWAIGAAVGGTWLAAQAAAGCLS